MTLQLQVGKTYLDERGKIVHIVAYYPDEPYNNTLGVLEYTSIYGPRRVSRWYNLDGTSRGCGPNRTIVEEYVEPDLRWFGVYSAPYQAPYLLPSDPREAPRDRKTAEKSNSTGTLQYPVIQLDINKLPHSPRIT